MPGPVTEPGPLAETVSVRWTGGGGGFVRSKFADTSRSARMVSLHHSPVLVHRPPQPENRESGAAVACNVTLVPPSKGSEQSPGHEMPGPVTVPDPDPPRVTLTVYGGAVRRALSCRLVTCSQRKTRSCP